MKNSRLQINSFALHIIAMIFMLMDHMWATVITGNSWMNWVGRIAFPIFAFMIVEGYFHTGDFKKYIKRLLILALISEIPFNLMHTASIINPLSQNVIWTFLIALFCIRMIERVRTKGKKTATFFSAVGITVLGFLMGFVGMVDYFGFGVITVLLFYFTHERKWYNYLIQLAVLYWINGILIGGMDIPLHIGTMEFFLSTQTFAIFALPFIWLYNGEQGFHNRAIQYSFYYFYPVHIFVLYLIAWLMGM